MTAPDPLQAVADLRRCLKAQDHAGVSRLITLPATLVGLDELTAQAMTARLEADEAWRVAAAVQRCEAERARVQARIGPLLEEVIAVLAGAMLEQRPGRRRPAFRPPARAELRAAEWPTPRREAA